MGLAGPVRWKRAWSGSRDEAEHRGLGTEPRLLRMVRRGHVQTEWSWWRGGPAISPGLLAIPSGTSGWQVVGCNKERFRRQNGRTLGSIKRWRELSCDGLGRVMENSVLSV